MLNEIRQFYPKEYDIGRQAIQLVNQRFQSNLDENEAGFVTFHIVSSESQEGPVDFHEMLEVLKMIITTIEDYFQQMCIRDRAEPALSADSFHHSWRPAEARRSDPEYSSGFSRCQSKSFHL